MVMRKLETPIQYPGNKTRKIKELLRLFPKQSEYKYFVDLFAGSGSVSYHLIMQEYQKYGKTKCRYTINDIRNEICLLHKILKSETLTEQLIERLHKMPQHESIHLENRLRSKNAQKIFREIKEMLAEKPIHRKYLEKMLVSQVPQENIVGIVANFIFMQNFTLYSLQDTFRGVVSENPKAVLLNRLRQFENAYLENVIIRNQIYDAVIPKMSFRNEAQKKDVFIYSDPPYYDTHNPYGTAFPASETEALFKLKAEYAAQGMKAAISEFDSDFVQEVAGDYGFAAHKVCERVNLNNVRTEMLYIKGYDPTGTNTQTNLFI